MVTHERNSLFASISQRVVYSYLRLLADFQPVVPEGSNPQERSEVEAAQRDLRAFFGAFYTALYETPGQFGLPLDEDVCIVGGEEDSVKYKQEVKKKLDKVHALIDQGLAFLMLLGLRGRLDGPALALDREAYKGIVKESKVKKPFLAGLVEIGLVIAESAETASISSPAYPGLPAALKPLAVACAGYEDQRQGRFNFARCDFRALDGCFVAQTPDLIAFFEPVDRERVERLRRFFFDLDYKEISRSGSFMDWDIQYQPRPKIKGSPLLRIGFSERHKVSLQPGIKCVATARLIPLIYEQSRALQEDFSRRLNPCNGSACNWCKDKKGLGPAVFEFDGKKRTVCWYHNPDMAELNEETLELIQEYALMHEKLA